VIARLRERVEVTVIDSLGFSVDFIQNLVFPKPRRPVVMATVVIHITYELLGLVIERSSNIVSLFKELENIRIDA
jgi:hypothetical protein